MTTDYEDIGFSLDYSHVVEIDITPRGVQRTWAWLAAGIQNMAPEGNEVIDETPYYNGKGSNAADVTGGQFRIPFSGHRRYGDPAQDFIASLALSYGESRKTNCRYTMPDGTVFEGPVTITDLVPGGNALGDANTKGAFSGTIRFNVTPEITPGDATKLPQSVSASAVTVEIGEDVEVSPTITPTSASDKCLYAIGDPDIAVVSADGLISGVAEGETELTITAAAKPDVMTRIKVTVGA